MTKSILILVFGSWRELPFFLSHSISKHFVSMDIFHLHIRHARPMFIAPVMLGRQNLTTSP